MPAWEPARRPKDTSNDELASASQTWKTAGEHCKPWVKVRYCGKSRSDWVYSQHYLVDSSRVGLTLLLFPCGSHSRTLLFQFRERVWQEPPSAHIRYVQTRPTFWRSRTPQRASLPRDQRVRYPPFHVNTRFTPAIPDGPCSVGRRFTGLSCAHECSGGWRNMVAPRSGPLRVPRGACAYECRQPGSLAEAGGRPSG
jgi:hypothetical protein